MKPKLKKTLFRHRFAFFGALFGVVIAGAGIVAVLFLPISFFPIGLGMTVFAISKGLGAFYSVLIGFGVVIASGAIGAGIGKLMESIIPGGIRMLGRGISFLIEASLNVAKNVLARSKQAVTPIASFPFQDSTSLALSFYAKERQFGHMPSAQDGMNLITLKILCEISKIKKETGWQIKVKTLREQYFKGNEEIILNEFLHLGDELKNEFIRKLSQIAEEVDEADHAYGEFFSLKLKVLFHPDFQRASGQLAEQTELFDRLARAFDGWLTYVSDELKYASATVLMNLKNEQLLSMNNRIIAILTETNKMLKEAIKRMEQNLSETNAGMQKWSEQTDALEIRLASLEGRFGVDPDNLGQRFSASLSGSRLSVFRLSPPRNTAYEEKAKQPLLLKSSEDADSGKKSGLFQA
jgi:hypothetical protein